MRANKFVGSMDRPLEKTKLADIWSKGEGMGILSRWQMLVHLSRVAWRGIALSPVTSLLSLVTISFSLFLLATFLLFVQNAGLLVSSARDELSMSLYVKEGVPPDRLEELRRDIAKLPEVERVEVRTKEEALRLFAKSLGEDVSLVAGLSENNPLPPSLEVKFRKEKASDEVFRRLENDYTGTPFIESVQYGKGVLSQLGKIAGAIRSGGMLGVLFMLLVTGFIISNTISLALYSHRDEIEIMELVGATDRYIEAPFLIEGFAQGFIGACMSLFALSFVHASLAGLLETSGLPDVAGFSFSSLGFFWSLVVILSGAGIGLASSFISVRRFSRRW